MPSTTRRIEIVLGRSSTTSFLTATTLIYAIGAGITAAAGTRLALQLFLAKRLTLFSFQYRRNLVSRFAISCHWLPELGLANFLPCCQTVVVVAVSQAPSPESNPNSPLPVTAMVVQYTTIES